MLFVCTTFVQVVRSSCRLLLQRTVQPLLMPLMPVCGFANAHAEFDLGNHEYMWQKCRADAACLHLHGNLARQLIQIILNCFIKRTFSGLMI